MKPFAPFVVSLILSAVCATAAAGGGIMVLQDAFSPSWSPDGSEFVCCRPTGGEYGDEDIRVWRVSASGQDTTLVISDPLGAFEPLWLPDGQHIVYNRFGSGAELVVFDLKGGAPVVWPVPGLWDDPGLYLAPGGGEVLYSIWQPTGGETWALDLADGTTRFVWEGLGGTISPDGEWIAFFTSGDTLAVAPLSGGAVRRFELGTRACWTPDSRFVVFTGISESGTFDLIMVSRDGSCRWELTDDPLMDWSGEVSPDGKQLLFTRCLSGDTPPFDVWALDLETPACSRPEVVSYEPSLVTTENCTVSFHVGTQDDYSAVSMITLERYLEGMWIPEDSVLAPLLDPTWTLTCVFDQHYTDGDHVFRAVFHSGDGSSGYSELVTVTADRGVPVLIGGFGPEYCREGVALRWTIEGGALPKGFNIYRSSEQRGPFERINEQLIPADQGNEYIDRHASPGRTYWYQLGAVADDGEWMSQTVSIAVPRTELTLHQNVPNPFNPTTMISFTLAERMPVTLAIYDADGREVVKLVEGARPAGVNEVAWDGRSASGASVATGVYFYRLKAGDKVLTRKMLLLK
jgi:hypothetical protein